MNTIKSVRRFDLGQITSVERTPQGFLKVPGFATRTGVFTYIDSNGQVRRELRHPDDVFDPESLATLRNAPVTLEHPPVMLTPSNVNQYMKGYTTDRVEVNRDLVETDLIIAVNDAIQAVEEKGMRELSSGYLADLEEVSGVYNGTQYDVRQRNIKYNHLAIVKRGRAGPEARLRLDSADAVMQTPPQPANQFQTEGENDSEQSNEGKATKPIVIGGVKLDLPIEQANIIQDFMDRYDQLRGEVAKLTEESDMQVKRKDDYGMMKDVDINQKGISPQVKVEQMAPDGRGSAGKAGAGDMSGPAKAKGDEEQHGVVGGMKPNSYEGGQKALQDDEDEKKEDPKKDYEGAQGGVAMSPADLLKHEMEELQAQLQGMKGKYDALMAKHDEMAAQSMGQGENAPGGQKMDSADVRSYVRARVKLERLADKIVPTTISAKFDSMSDDEIRAAVIKHRHPKADLQGKSSVYLQTRFDTIAESFEEGESTRKEMGGALLFGNGSRMDSREPVNPSDARRAMIEGTRALWKQPLSASKK
jgi:hypothetical protein